MKVEIYENALRVSLGKIAGLRKKVNKVRAQRNELCVAMATRGKEIYDAKETIKKLEAERELIPAQIKYLKQQHDAMSAENSKLKALAHGKIEPDVALKSENERLKKAKETLEFEIGQLKTMVEQLTEANRKLREQPRLEVENERYDLPRIRP